MDRYSQFGLRSEADEQIRRGFRDALARAGLSHEQFLDALGWYRDHGQHLGADPSKLAESFREFASNKGWDAGHVAAATSAYDMIAEQGPAAVLATPSAEEDAATIARADGLLRTNPDAYWRDQGLQELALEARERQLAAPPPEPGIDHDAIERRVAQQEVDRFAAMLRQPAEAAKYWASAELRRAVRCHARRSGHAQPARRPGAGEGHRLGCRPQRRDRDDDAHGWRQGLLARPGRPARARRSARSPGRAAALPASTGRCLGGGCLVESRGRLRPVDYRAARRHAGIVGPATCCVFIAHSTCFASRLKMTCTSSVATQYSYPGVRGVSHESIACGLSNMCSSFLL
jgi:hypothetical protein